MIKSFEKYLTKHPCYVDPINIAPQKLLNNIIAIPVYNEPNLLSTLQSIKEAQSTKYATEVIILINQGSKTPEYICQQNLKTYKETQSWANKNSTSQLAFHVLFFPDMPNKHAGVGLARKTIMDEAVRRFSLINNENGIIISLDADTTIDKSYLIEAEKNFCKNKKLNVILPWFEHNITNLPTDIQNAISKYELYLRYFKLCLYYTGFPHAHHTIGSAFAVRAMAYVKQGGMNKKQGGEDFYFLHKVFSLGQVKTLNNVSVYPSGRISDRVPFGTGPAVQKIINEGEFKTYNPKYFSYLKCFFSHIEHLYRYNSNELYDFYHTLNSSIKEFLPFNEFEIKVNEIKNNSSNTKTFANRFYSWFDAFKIIKYLNSNHNESNRITITKAACDLLILSGYENPKCNNIYQLLEIFKEIELKLTYN